MIFVDKTFELVLKKYRVIPEVKEVLDKLYRYKLSIQTESPRLKKQDIHVIGMAHKLNEGFDSEQCPITIDQVIASQKKLISVLYEITPDIVGIEGFSGEKFSFREAIKEAYKIQGLHCFEKDIEFHTQKMKNNPQQQDFWNYITNNAGLIFCGTEDYELHRLQNKLYKLLIPIKSFEDYEALSEGVLRLRGILMVVKLSRLMRKTGSKTAALPIGFLHLKEIAEFKTYLNANLIIHNVTEMDIRKYVL